MKKLFLALLIAAVGPAAIAATVTLSTGASCNYTGIAFAGNGSATVQCVDVGTVVVVPPVVTPPPVVVAPPPVVVPPSTCMVSTGGMGGMVPGPCVAGGLWVQGRNRLSTTRDLRAGDSVESDFTIPPGWRGTVEVGISGANLKVEIDGAEYVGPRTDLATGRHIIRMVATALASGSIDLYHDPR